jgi:hypothetical protein
LTVVGLGGGFDTDLPATGNIDIVGNVVGSLTGNHFGTYANITQVNATTCNVGNIRMTGGNVAVSGQINALGNVVAPFFVGNGSQLTGVKATNITAGPVFSLYASNTQTFSGAATVNANVSYDAKVFDPLSVASATGVITIPTTGYYQINASVAFNPFVSSSVGSDLRVFVNSRHVNTLTSIAYPNIDIFTSTVNPPQYSGGTLIRANVGDVLTIRFNNGGTSQTVFGNSSGIFTTFTGYYVCA